MKRTLGSARCGSIAGVGKGRGSRARVMGRRGIVEDSAEAR